MRGHVITEQVRLVSETCCNCGVLFAISEAFQEKRIQDRAWFYCPAGHSQHYTGRNLEDEVRDLERRLASAHENTRVEEAAHQITKRELARTEKRIHAGVCPHCHRTFQNAARHMDTKHGPATPRPPARQRRAEVVEGDEPWHGTLGGYNNHHCRGPRCRDAKRTNQKRYLDAHPDQREKSRRRERKRRTAKGDSTT